MNPNIKRTKTPGVIPTVNHFPDSNTYVYNEADGKLYGLRIVNGVRTVILIGGDTTVAYSTSYDCAVITVTADAQAVFTTPPHIGASKTFVILNGIHYNHPADYSITGTTLTWSDDLLEEGEILYFYHIPEE